MFSGHISYYFNITIQKMRGGIVSPVIYEIDDIL
jgi:hypothetical protein